MTPLPSLSHLWTRCPAAAQPADPDVPRGSPSELGAEMAAAEWATSCLLYGDRVSVEELVGRRGLAIDVGRLVADYCDVVRNWAPAPSERYEICRSPAPRVAVLDVGWRVVEPGTDPRHLLAGVEAFPDRDVTFTVYQPRPHHPDGKWREVTRSAYSLSAWRTWYDQRLALASEPNPVAVPGEQCGTCRRRSRCPAIARATYADRDLVASRAPGERMDGWELSAELDFLLRAKALLEARISGVEAEAEARVRAGEWIPWWVVAPGQGRRQVTASPLEVQWLTGLDPHRKVLKTPSELEREGATREQVRAVSRYEQGAPKLKRLTPEAVGRMFKR